MVAFWTARKIKRSFEIGLQVVAWLLVALFYVALLFFLIWFESGITLDNHALLVAIFSVVLLTAIDQAA
jgi:hypothetical protein